MNSVTEKSYKALFNRVSGLIYSKENCALIVRFYYFNKIVRKKLLKDLSSHIQFVSTYNI